MNNSFFESNIFQPHSKTYVVVTEVPKGEVCRQTDIDSTLGRSGFGLGSSTDFQGIGGGFTQGLPQSIRCCSLGKNWFDQMMM